MLASPHCLAQAEIDWKSDLTFLASELPKKHINLFSIKSKGEFFAGIERIRNDSTSDFGRAIQLQQLIASMGDSHTRVNLGRFIDRSKLLPMHVYWFSDGIFILHTTEPNKGLLGKRLVAVNNTPIQVVVDSLRTLITIDNEAALKVGIPELLPLIQLHEHFGFVGDEEINLTVQGTDDQTETLTITPGVLSRQNRIMVTPDPLPLCYKNESALFNHYYVPEDRALYLQYNKCWSRELELKHGKTEIANQLPSFLEFEEQAFKTLSNDTVNKIIVDLRLNQGGNSKQGTNFAQHLSSYLKKNKEVKLYVILGRHTFSSAILNAIDFKRMTKASFVGEQTAGMPNHFGEVRTLTLPSSGANVSYSTKYFKVTNEVGNTLAPDVPLTTRFSDFVEGIDPVYEWIRKQ